MSRAQEKTSELSIVASETIESLEVASVNSQPVDMQTPIYSFAAIMCAVMVLGFLSSIFKK